MRLAAAAARSFSPVEDTAEFDGLGPDLGPGLVDDLVAGIARSLAELPRLGSARTREFLADSPAKARTQAVDWLRDFAAHPPLELENIRTEPRGEAFVAAVTFRSCEAMAAAAGDAQAASPQAGQSATAAAQMPDEAAQSTPDLPEAQLFAFEIPAVRKLPPVAPLLITGEDTLASKVG